MLSKLLYQSPTVSSGKADRLQKQPARAQSIGVWALYEEMKAFYGLTGEEAYNFSHSGNYVLCSVCTEYRKSGSEIKVGCDVEQVGKVRLDLAARFFCRSEYQDIAKEEDGETNRTLLSILGTERKLYEGNRRGDAAWT